MKLNFMSTRFLRILVAAGYLLMCLLAGGIMYLWYYEWKEIEVLAMVNQRINNFRQEIHHVYGQIAGHSLLGESVLEWKDEDLEYYNVRRMFLGFVRQEREAGTDHHDNHAPCTEPQK